ncbi:MAG: hypothetical protein WC934_04920 [Acidithiobacillus sp.]|jgi:hypothetical protein|uniref:hypothetical protein n=1 Tax=Acidithiobacillus sp. TaxID=1872118 RepID=UPI00355FF6FE
MVNNNNFDLKLIFSYLLSILIWTFLLSWILMLIWNEVLVDAINILNKIGYWDSFLLFFVFNLFISKNSEK